IVPHRPRIDEEHTTHAPGRDSASLDGCQHGLSRDTKLAGGFAHRELAVALLDELFGAEEAIGDRWLIGRGHRTVTEDQIHGATARGEQLDELVGLDPDARALR